MKPRTVLIAILVIAVITPSPANGCTRGWTICSPCNQILYDVCFDESCPYWVFTGNAQLNNGIAVLAGAGSVYQEVTIDTGHDNVEIWFSIDVQLGTGSGTERLFVEVVSSSDVILQTVDTFTPSSSDGGYGYQLGDFSGQTIRLRFRYGTGLDPGDTVFNIECAGMWTY